ncbi:MAG: 50S ribosomal protein L13 [Candidatus Moranbacteria bacterium RIFOXYA12_FULL_44_15]|nr:MAG: 50S ribosomal protein L13 [Candidatus Moranbacteria bacterium RIFOXYA12_FULL_44_15]
MANQINRKYHLFDAEDKSPGRLATEIATVLRGKNKVDFAPHIDGGDFAVVVNSDKFRITGNKMEGKLYHRFSGYPGGISTKTLKDRMESESEKVIRDAVWGMLPKNKLRDRMIKRLLVYKDDKHEHKIEINH